MEANPRTAIFFSSSPSGKATIPGIPGWGIVTVHDPRRARRVIEEHEARVGLALCECGSDRRNRHLFEDFIDELEAHDIVIQWIAFVSTHPSQDDHLSRLIGQRFFDFP